mmetsp:Transcript_11439/g.18529  ORF Transcript_11439/g.18529 Transcript_11439/m.18529 type:complete len:406 (-) Transcript_11439:524-1741(-)
METLEICCGDLGLLSPESVLDTLERYEFRSVDHSDDQEVLYDSLQTVLMSGLTSPQAGEVFSALCSMLRSCPENVRDEAALWAGRFVLLDQSRSEATRINRKLNMAGKIMRIFIERHGVETEEGSLLMSPSSSVVGDGSYIDPSTRSDSLHSSAAAMPDQNGHHQATSSSPGEPAGTDTPSSSGTASSGRKSFVVKKRGLFSSLKSKMKGFSRSAGNSGDAHAAPSNAPSNHTANSTASEALRHSNIARDEIPATHRLSIADYNMLSVRKSQTKEELIQKYGRPPAPPPLHSPHPPSHASASSGEIHSSGRMLQHQHEKQRPHSFRASMTVSAPPTEQSQHQPKDQWQHTGSQRLAGAAPSEFQSQRDSSSQGGVFNSVERRRSLSTSDVKKTDESSATELEDIL